MCRKRAIAVCMIIVLLGVCIIPTGVPGYTYAAEKEDDARIFEEMRKKWRDSLLGGELDAGNPAVQVYIKSIDETALQYWDTMIKSEVPNRKTLWDGLDMSFISGTGQEARMHTSAIYNHYLRLKSIAVAWATPGCTLYQNQEVKEELLDALKYMNDNHYNADSKKCPFFGNWWSWEIGAPVALCDILLIMRGEIPQTDVEQYIAAVNRFTPNCREDKETGANLIDKGMVVAQVGMLTDDKGKLLHVKNAYKKVFQYVTQGDGFHKDGSFIQHSKIAYIGAYGTDLYEKLGMLFYIFDDTPWEFVYEDGAEQLVYDMVFKAIEPFLYDGRCMDMVRGRGITRRLDSDKSQGVKLLGTIIPLMDAFPTEEERERFKSMVKYLVGVDEDYFYETCRYPLSILSAYEIMNDSTIEPRSNYQIHQLSSGMDRLVHITPEFGVGIAMTSKRTAGHEIINDEGRRTWNVADGMTYFYNKDRDQYGNGYWATVDPRRLPGTTSEYVMRKNGAGNNASGAYDWSGGSGLELYGTVGAHMKTLGNEGSRDGTDVKKSWFLFDDEVVAIGSGITSATGNYVETVVDNRRLKEDGSNKVTVDGQEVDIRAEGGDEAERGVKLESPSWIHLEGNAEGTDMGYYFPEKTEIMALKEERTGSWNDQNGMADASFTETNYFAAFWFEHGKKPEQASYEYVVLPNKTADQVEAYSQNPDIEILENSTEVHAAKEKSLGITAVNFWNGTNRAVGGIQCKKPASVVMREDEDSLEIGIADPTRKQTEPIEVVIYKRGDCTLEKDENITVLGTSPFIRISVDTNGTLGQTSRIRFKLLPGDDYEMTEGQTEAVCDVYVEAGKNGDKAGGDYESGGELKLKTETKLSERCRKTAMKFDLTALPEDWDDMVLSFQVRSFNKDFSSAQIYRIENDWAGDTITYNSFPKRIDEKPAAEFLRSAVESGPVVNIDVGQAVRKALAHKETEISFEITIDKGAGDNYLGIYSTESKGESILAPCLRWSRMKKTDRADKRNLMFVLELAENLELSDFSNKTKTKLPDAITAGQKVLEKEDASEQEIREAEARLTKELSSLRLK